MKTGYKPTYLAILIGFFTVISVAVATSQIEDNSISDSASQQLNTGEVYEATRYMKDMGDFAFGCNNAMNNADLKNRAIAECLDVIHDFNSNMSHLWDEHRDTIDYYRAKSTGDSSDSDSSLRDFLN